MIKRIGITAVVALLSTLAPGMVSAQQQINAFIQGNCV